MTEPAPPLQNRVTPEGDIVAVRARGTLMGNRGGALHRADRRLGARRWVSRQWICCRLDFRGRQRTVMAPGRYTELFFLDEATALAAGHRPCFECRREDARRFAALFAGVHGHARPTPAPVMDRILHAERLTERGEKRCHVRSIADLPDGAIVLMHGEPHLVLGSRLLTWTDTGYSAAIARASAGDTEVLTPPSIVAVLSAGFRPALHPSTLEHIAQSPPLRPAEKDT